MTAAQAALPLDNPFSAPSLPRLRGTERQIAFASRIRDDEILTCRSIWDALDRGQGWHPVGVRAARARHFAAWAKVGRDLREWKARRKTLAPRFRW